MKAYRIELLVIDFDGLGADGVRSAIENTSYANDCISPSVVTVDERDIGEWSDDNPLNNRNTADAEFRRLFSAPAAGAEKDAERYRFRKQFLANSGAFLYGSFGCQLRRAGELVATGANEEEAIDAAIAAHTKAKEDGNA